MDFLSNINSKEFTISAFIIGYLLCDDLTPAKQNSVGNWFMLIGQVLATNASQQQVINNANKTSNSSNRHIINDDDLTDIEELKRVINIINDKLNNL